MSTILKVKSRPFVCITLLKFYENNPEFFSCLVRSSIEFVKDITPDQRQIVYNRIIQPNGQISLEKLNDLLMRIS